MRLPLRWLQDNGLRASSDDNDLSSGLLMLICGDVIRPGLAWMLTRTHRYLALVMAETRDPAGFARLRKPRRLSRGRGEITIAQTAPAAFAKDELLSVLSQVGNRCAFLL